MLCPSGPRGWNRNVNWQVQTRVLWRGRGNATNQLKGAHRERQGTEWVRAGQHGMGKLPNPDANLWPVCVVTSSSKCLPLMGLFHLKKVRAERAEGCLGFVCPSNTSSCWTAGQCCPEGFWPSGPFWRKKCIDSRYLWTGAGEAGVHASVYSACSWEIEQALFLFLTSGHRKGTGTGLGPLTSPQSYLLAIT